jgi:restriction endonuclease S subunit
MKRTVENSKINVKNGKFFRGGVKKVKEGASFVIQLRDIVQNSRSSYLNFSKMLRIDVSSKASSHFLQKGDVLVMVKGAHKKAFHLNEVPSKTLATQHFLILRSPNEQEIMPEFIEHIVNSKESQGYFYRKCGGSYESLLNKKTLSELPFPLVSIENQKKILMMIKEAQIEKKLLLDLIENRQHQVQAYALKIIKAGK